MKTNEKRLALYFSSFLGFGLMIFLTYNTINQADELFNHLQVWRDKNQDALVQEGELTSLKDEESKELIVNHISICRLHVEQKQENKEVA